MNVNVHWEFFGWLKVGRGRGKTRGLEDAVPWDSGGDAETWDWGTTGRGTRELGDVVRIYKFWWSRGWYYAGEFVSTPVADDFQRP